MGQKRQKCAQKGPQMTKNVSKVNFLSGFFRFIISFYKKYDQKRAQNDSKMYQKSIFHLDFFADSSEFYRLKGFRSQRGSRIENHHLCGKCQWAQSKHCTRRFHSQGRRVASW